MKRIKNTFQLLKNKGQKAFVAYICAGDPNYEISLEILKKLPENGVDIIELGIPFLDPAGDGPIIEEASKRAIANGMNFKKVLNMVADFRKENQNTPIILMGYYNNFLKYGIDKIFQDIEKSGGDGVLIVDLPFEEKNEIHNEISKTNLDFINLISPLSDEFRIKKISEKASGFLYLISMLGITGTKEAKIEDNIEIIKKIRKNSNLEIAIGFGIKDFDKAKEFAKSEVDAVIVGSRIVKEINDNFLQNKTKNEIVKNVLLVIEKFNKAIKEIWN